MSRGSADTMGYLSYTKSGCKALPQSGIDLLHEERGDLYRRVIAHLERIGLSGCRSATETLWGDGP